MFRTLLFLILAYLPSYAHGAQISVLPADSNGPAAISITGKLAPGDERVFKKFALTLEEAVVVFDSNGGNLIAGIEIGRAIRLQEYSTTIAEYGTCASACALAWLGGIQRFLPPNAQVGFHLAYIKGDKSATVSGQGNAVVGAYLNQLGLPQSAILYATSAAPHEMRWLSKEDAQAVGIEVTILQVRPPSKEKTMKEAKDAYDLKDFATAIKLYGLLAVQGEASAQFILGTMYDQGMGAPQDYAVAAKWYRMAADQGLAEAQMKLGGLYATGQGVLQDDVEAAKWFLLAAHKGVTKAQEVLGLMYASGKGVPQDNVQAYVWSNLAAAGGNTLAGRLRDTYAKHMTRDQIADAQRIAREWLAVHQK